MHSTSSHQLIELGTTPDEQPPPPTRPTVTARVIEEAHHVPNNGRSDPELVGSQEHWA